MDKLTGWRKRGLVLLCAILTLIFAGCSERTGGAADTLSGDLSDILTSVLNGANELLDEQTQLGKSFEDVVTAENCQGMLGLSAEEFEQSVAEAYVSTAAVITSAHEVALIKCKDFESASLVKKQVAAGFDSNKWICVTPDQSFVIDSGSYVLLAATTNAHAEAIKQSFETVAGSNVGDADVFYTSAAGE
jgi:hypothetical protein